jgi:hypothetical protein
MPLVARSETAVAQLIGVGLPELQASFANRVIRDDDSPGEQQLFEVAVAEAKPEIESHHVADDFRWKSVIPVGGDSFLTC